MTSPIKARQRILILIGSLGFFGFLPASGTITVGTIGIALFYLARDFPVPLRAFSVCALTAIAIWIHHRGDQILGEKDSRKLVWDEVVGYAVAVMLVPFSWPIAILAFVVERILDILKVPPAGWIEREWPGGLGVVGDDVVAGVYTYAMLYAAIHLAPSWLGLPN